MLIYISFFLSRIRRQLSSGETCGRCPPSFPFLSSGHKKNSLAIHSYVCSGGCNVLFELRAAKKQSAKRKKQKAKRKTKKQKSKSQPFFFFFFFLLLLMTVCSVSCTLSFCSFFSLLLLLPLLRGTAGREQNKSFFASALLFTYISIPKTRLLSSLPFPLSLKGDPWLLLIAAEIPRISSAMAETAASDGDSYHGVLDPPHSILNNVVEGGGANDFYGEESATEDQSVTPWTRNVACGPELLRDPSYNKGLAFTDREREQHYLLGLLPPAHLTQELQVEKIMKNLRSYSDPLQKYIAVMGLQERNERLFYKVLIDNVEELLPVVYTPTVGEACQKYGAIFQRPRGLYISLKEKGKVLDVLKNWPEKLIQVIVVTDGERILGLGDLGCQGMGIPVGKLALYTALGGVRASGCLPITIDVGTNNETLLKDPFYIGLNQRRTTGKEYDDLLHEFMYAVKKAYGEKVLIQFEDFANHNAFKLLAKYQKTHLVFNDDIQGTAVVVLGGLLGALKITGGTLADHTFLFLGAGEAGTGIGEMIALHISKQTGISLEEARSKIWMVDSKGLVVKSRWDSLQHFKQNFAHDHEECKDLLSAVKALKPTILIGTSGQGKTFTKEVIETFSSYNKKPVVMALSNPTSQSECTAEEAYQWSKGEAIFASGSPFDPVTYEGKTYVPGQGNNAYIFPGVGHGVLISDAIRLHDDMLLAAAEALAAQVTEEHLSKGLVYPPFSNIRKISASISAAVAEKAYELGLATKLPKPADLLSYAESCMYSPNYRQYR